MPHAGVHYFFMHHTKSIPDQVVLKDLLDYFPDTGRLVWKERELRHFHCSSKNIEEREVVRWNGRHSGKDALASIDQCGSRKGCLLNGRYHTHRVIWKWVTGEDPIHIDHINGNRADNRWCNLRSVTHGENMKNRARHKNAPTAISGVGMHQGRWRSRICVDNRHIFLGQFDTFEEAVAARKAAEIEYGFHPNHGRHLPP